MKAAFFGRRLLGMAASAGAFLSSGVALAAESVASDRIENVRTFDLQVQGRITERCSMGSMPNVNFGDLSRRGLRASANIQLDCNVPFTMNIVSARGGLAHESLPNGQGGYDGTLPYSLDVAIPVRRPTSAAVAKSFTSEQLRGGGLISTGGGIATEGMTLAVNLGTPSSQAGLLAGNYSETITITIAPQ